MGKKKKSKSKWENLKEIMNESKTQMVFAISAMVCSLVSLVFGIMSLGR